MLKFIVFVILVFVGINAAYNYYNRTGFKFGLDQLPFFKGSIAVSSPDFADGDVIPTMFTCDGANVSPQINISNLPKDVKSLAILLEDGSLPSKPVTQWLIYNMNPNTKTISSSDLSGNGSAGTNDYGKLSYSGPCPPLGKTHRYYFRVYALNKTFDQLTLGRYSFDKLSTGHILATGTMTGVYSKSP